MRECKTSRFIPKFDLQGPLSNVNHRTSRLPAGAKYHVKKNQHNLSRLAHHHVDHRSRALTGLEASKISALVRSVCQRWLAIAKVDIAKDLPVQEDIIVTRDENPFSHRDIIFQIWIYSLCIAIARAVTTF